MMLYVEALRDDSPEVQGKKKRRILRKKKEKRVRKRSKTRRRTAV